MNTRLLASPRLYAAAALIVGGLAFAATRDARADEIVSSGASDYTVTVFAPIPAPAHVGPGIGGSKSPYYPSPAETAAAQSQMYFHVVEHPIRTLTYHMGPGTGSVKTWPFTNPTITE
jgi:hypothetical protein